MHVNDDPEGPVTLLVITVVVIIAFVRFLRWIEDQPLQPEPWNEATERAVHEDEALPVCHRCFTPAPPGQWFCETCGCAVGPYNNWMPYLHVFSQGEVLRNGVTDRIRRNPLTVVGYVLISLSAFQIFAPIYWYFLFRRWKSGSKEGGSATED